MGGDWFREYEKKEEFVREKVAAKPFQGSGNVLGSIAPSVAPPTADASMDPKQVIRKILLNHILRNDEEK